MMSKAVCSVLLLAGIVLAPTADAAVLTSVRFDDIERGHPVKTIFHGQEMYTRGGRAVQTGSQPVNLIFSYSDGTSVSSIGSLRMSGFGFDQGSGSLGGGRFSSDLTDGSFSLFDASGGLLLGAEIDATLTGRNGGFSATLTGTDTTLIGGSLLSQFGDATVETVEFDAKLRAPDGFAVGHRGRMKGFHATELLGGLSFLLRHPLTPTEEPPITPPVVPAAPIPEPSTGVLFAMGGLLALFGSQRKKLLSALRC